MKITTCASDDGDNNLDDFDPDAGFSDWHLVIAGYWSDSPFHSGYVEYMLGNTRKGVWVLLCIERNENLDGVTQEDIDEGNLNDDQLQALWGMTLEEAQAGGYRSIVAVCEEAEVEVTREEVALMLYEALKEQDGKIVDEPIQFGLIAS